MNVLYLTNNAGRASTTVGTRGWITHLHRRGLRPVIVSPIVGEFSDWAMNEYDVNSYRQELPFPSKTNPVPYLTAMWRLRRIIRRHAINLIHAIEQDVYPIAADLAQLCRLPAVVGIHCRMARGFGEWAFGGRRRPRRMFFLTRASREVCRPAVRGVVPEANWRLLTNGLDVERFRPNADIGRQFREEHGLGNGPLIGAASWLRPGKQLEHSFQVAARLNHFATFVLAGGVAPGEEAYAKKLLSAGEQLLGDRLRFVGCLDDLRGFYNALDLYVNTSKEETCSISIVESLACGCPVVGYPSISVAEQVLPSGGEIVAQDDCEQLTAAVARWVQDAERRQQAREGARQRAEESFDICKISSQLWDEYLDVVAERNSARPATAEVELLTADTTH
jgi:glycosyltransferase involved in cell wall biosynthesis